MSAEPTSRSHKLIVLESAFPLPDEQPPEQPPALAHLYELLLRRARAHPTAVALGGQEGLGWRKLTSVELLGHVDRLADELAAEGVQAGDRVVLWLPNHWRTPVYLFALWKLGAIVVPFDREMNPEAGASILQAVEPRCIIGGYEESPAWAARESVLAWWDPGARGGQPTVDRA